ncbi:hypothetical protein K493DRAFT_276122 [Basidiobolus meristosporus CBS 931.73]|uniref:Adenylate kinase n=1 Tax=Basidiobolus meristosporus CBS 931.73 TaxID=1314790 RepID=A0A1Y1Z1E1_9FUNG|nr:hypothetical protein K493DRAFT_276122 [Basidiobolus meristosporus CBS 931.73]|eukprot:ORY04102.1 hypothetical protein K493DRAFT_276122 [Basidiobolus meristosporus CBS 931.73]
MSRMLASHFLSYCKSAVKRSIPVASLPVRPQLNPRALGSVWPLGSMIKRGHYTEHDISTPITSSSENTCKILPKTARETFDEAWSHIEGEYGKQNLRYPTDIIWLMGAPGAGKGANTPCILKARKITNPSICMSSLLTSPEMKKLMDQGKMIEDSQVLELMFRALLDRDSNVGVLIDGFPRTETQVSCLKYFYDKLVELHEQFKYTPLANRFRMPSFSIAVLYVDEEISIARQLKRGKQIREHNEKVRKTGVGQLLEERATDFDEEIVRKRYQVFTQHYSALMELGKYFPFHLVNASSTLEDVTRQFNALLDPTSISDQNADINTSPFKPTMKEHPGTQHKPYNLESHQ